METPDAIEKMAFENLKDARAILNNNRNSVRNARYLAGYSIELVLKSQIARTLNIPNLFSSNYKKHQQAFLIHDLYQLLFYSGLFVKFEDEKIMESKGEFIKDWSRIKAWNSSWRYSIDKCSEQTAREFINSCERLTKWIREN